MFKYAPQKLFASLFVLMFAVVLRAQTPIGTPPPLVLDSDEEIRVESRLVIVPVSVTDMLGRPVTGLGLEHFRIFENRRSQEVAEVSAADQVPLEIAVLIDISGTTNPMFKFEQETAARFLEEVMRPEDRATIFTIGAEPVLLQSRNVAFRSIETIRGVVATKQYTAFYDTVMEAANYLRENAAPKSRKVVIAITDGEDTNSTGVKKGLASIYASLGKQIDTITSEDLRELMVQKRHEIRIKEQDKTVMRLQNADTVFYSINPAGSSYKLNKISQFGQENLNRFAAETGGSAYLPQFLPVDLKSDFENKANLRKNTATLSSIFSQLKNELQAQYLVQYYSDGEFADGKYVEVELGVNHSPTQSLTVRSRKGYFVRKQ